MPSARPRLWSHYTGRLRLVGWRVGAGRQEDVRPDRRRVAAGRPVGSRCMGAGGRRVRPQVGGPNAWRPALGLLGPAAAWAGPLPALRRPGQERPLAVAGLVPPERTRRTGPHRGSVGPPGRQG